MIEIKVQGIDNVLAAFNELLRRGQDLTPVMKEISQALLDQTEENFDQEGRPRWPDLAPSTIRERSRKGYWPGKMLQRTAGGLASSVEPHYDAVSAALRVAKPYAAIQQLGGKAGRGHKVTIPPRPYLPITATAELQPEAKSDVLEIFNRYLREAWEK